MVETAPPTSIDPAVPARGPGRRYRHDWALFRDWCTAADLTSLPAEPRTLGLFLAENPAAPGTQRSRMIAINWHHDRADLPAPGRSETIRSALDANRSRRLDCAQQALWQRLPEIPTTGWPQGVFGRRDGALLVLAASGLPFERISRLRRSEVTTGGEHLVIDGRYPLRLEPHQNDPAMAPAAVYRRWNEVLEFVDRHPSTRMLARHLTNGGLPEAGAAEPHRDGPVFTSIDRWGYLPLQPRALTAASIAAIVRQHLTGSAPSHTPPPGTRRLLPTAAAAPAVTALNMAGQQELSEYFEHGITARRSAHTALRDVSDVLDAVEARAETLLERTLAMITDWQLPAEVGE